MRRTKNIARFGFMLALAAVFWLGLTSNEIILEWSFSWDKANHALAFLVLSLLIDYALLETDNFFWQVCALMTIGLFLEWLQSLSGERSFEMLDLFANGMGIALYGAIRSRIRAHFDPILRVYLG